MSAANAYTKKAVKKYDGHSIYDRQLRPYENSFVIHSTTAKNYRKIKKQECIKSWNILKKEHSDFEAEPIGAMLGDPEYFRDYIMLGSGYQVFGIYPCEIITHCLTCIFCAIICQLSLQYIGYSCVVSV